MESWGSRRGFILAAIGSAVGIGNIWRFSSVLGENGGGAYLVPYLVAVFAFALPLMALELAVGRHLRADAVQAFRSLGRRHELAGWLIATIVFTILSYYLVITGWTLAYFVQSLAGGAPSFGAFTGGYWGVGAFAASAVVVGLVTSFGVKHGIELLASWLMPLAFVILLALAVYSVTLDGFVEGVSFMLEPDFSRLSEPGLWSAAFGQAFFSLSVGFGILLTYGSYLSRDTDVVESAAIITVADVLVAILAGMVIFPVVFTMGLEPSAGAELAFSTLPTAFEQMPRGALIAPAFFFLLFAAAVTSAVSMMELNVAAVMDRTRMSRTRTSAVLTVLVLGLGLPSALSYSGLELSVFGTRVLDLLDDTVGNLGLPIGALLIAIFFTRGIARTALVEEFNGTHGRRARALLLPLLRWVIPGVLVGVLATDVLMNLNPAGWHILMRDDGMPVWRQVVLTLALGAVLVSATVAVVALLRRINRAGPPP